jgi:hypothetical protein
MLVTMSMLRYAQDNYPNASQEALQCAQDNYADTASDQSDFDCYICSLAEAVITFPGQVVLSTKLASASGMEYQAVKHAPNRSGQTITIYQNCDIYGRTAMDSFTMAEYVEMLAEGTTNEELAVVINW